MERLVSRHAQVAGATQSRTGHAAAFLEDIGSKSALSACALLPLFRSLFDSLFVSSGKASVRDAAELDTSTGFSPIDLAARQADSLTKANKPTVKNSLGLDIEANDVGYVATVQIGTPRRNFSVLMDSGSADFWVGAEGCQSSTTSGADCVSISDQLVCAALIPLDMQGNHTFLGTKSSSSFVDAGQVFQVIYSTGTILGNVVQDNVAFGGFQLSGHTFGVATQVSDSLIQSPYDGRMGLALSKLSGQGTPTPVEALAKSRKIQSAITSYKISRLSDGLNDGEITFGGMNTNKFNQDAVATLENKNTLGFWEGSMDSVTVDGVNLFINDRTAIFDTGTTFLVVPDLDAQTIHGAIPGAQSDGNGGFTLPCTTTSSLVLTFDGIDFAIDPRDLTFKPVDASNPTGLCVSGITTSQGVSASQWIAGDVFLKNAYLSTNVDDNKIRLAI